MSKTNVPQNAGGTETIIGGVIAVGVIALIGFCCCGRSSKDTDYTSTYTPSSSSSTTSSSSTSSTPSSPSLSSSSVTSAKMAVVITENANLRKLNNSNSGVIQTVPKGTNVEVVKQEGAWFLVKNSSQTGWMHGNTIRLVSSTQSSSDSAYERTTPGYDPNAPLMPRGKGDIEPLYNEVQRLKEQEGMTDAEAVNKILRDAGEIP